MKILIVEDNMVNQKMIEMLIKPYSDDYDMAKDGLMAMDFFIKAVDNKERYDLVLLDIMLPKMDGQTLLQEFREIESKNNLLGNNGCKIIMVSALGDAGNIMEAFKNQCDGYLTKPYEKNSLLFELKKLGLID